MSVWNRGRQGLGVRALVDMGMAYLVLCHTRLDFFFNEKSAEMFSQGGLEMESHDLNRWN